jgi:hypothetical protein
VRIAHGDTGHLRPDPSSVTRAPGPILSAEQGLLAGVQVNPSLAEVLTTGAREMWVPA